MLDSGSLRGCADASETLVLTSTPGDEGNYTRNYALEVSDLMNNMISQIYVLY